MNGELPHDIYGLSGYGILWYEWLAITAVVLLAVVVAVAILKYLKRKPISKARPVAVQTVFEIWKERLQALQADAPFDRRQQVEFYYQLSLALRNGIEVVTKLPATDLTYKELRQKLKPFAGALPMDLGELLQFLNQADYVKFAERDRSSGDAARDRKQALTWLEDLESVHHRSSSQEVRA